MQTEYNFLNASELKYFTMMYEDYDGDEEGIQFSSLRKIALKYKRYNQHITMAFLNSFLKKLKDNEVARVNEADLFIS